MTQFHYVLLLFSQFGLSKRQVIVGLQIPGKYRYRCSRWKLLRRLWLSDGWPNGWHRGNSTRGRNLSFLGGRITLGSLSMDALLLSGWYMVYRMHFKWEAIFPKWERFHSSSYTWPRGGTEYHPHHALMFGALDPCDMSLYRRIKQGGSTVRNDRACRWVQGVKRCASRYRDIFHCHWIGRGDWMVEIKEASMDEDYIPYLFRFMAGIDDFSTFNKFVGYVPRWTQYPFRLVPFSLRVRS